jgi:hypothetical protein
MHAGDEEPVVRHYLEANRLSTPLGFSQFRKQVGRVSPRPQERVLTGPTIHINQLTCSFE